MQMTRRNPGHRICWIIFPIAQALALVWLGLATTGCGTTLEDGYKPRSLGASPDARKSYYASPFSDQAEAGAHESQPALHPGTH